MKKDLIFAPLLVVVAILLLLLKATGMPAHIAISVVGLGLLSAYSVLGRKGWKVLPLEIGMRISYGIALVTGVLLKVSYVFALAIAHKIFAALFVIALIIIIVHKYIIKKK